MNSVFFSLLTDVHLVTNYILEARIASVAASPLKVQKQIPSSNESGSFGLELLIVNKFIIVNIRRDDIEFVSCQMSAIFGGFVVNLYVKKFKIFT